ncbi:RES family NAD+ phosphorylase [Mycolicibacterium elephantis]|uniref:RES family NAD+ phosphorylase n=1 Tax=Mycolicibacterium elephantis TaxID=81858 RepID=UPI000B2DA980|nr:RES family NAD+ phosphorylase [Mycolicibacterium elephantis]
MSASVLWSVESDFVLDDRVQSRINTALGIAFHGVSSPGAYTVGHRFLVDSEDGSLILRVAMRTHDRYAIELVSVGVPDLGDIDISEWRRRAENAAGVEKDIASPADEHFPFTSIRAFNGAAVRITRPKSSPLMLPKLAPSDGRFHSAGDPMPLYSSTDFATAWASQVGIYMRQLAFGGVERRVTNLEIDGARLLDLQSPELMPLGLTQADLTGSGRNYVTVEFVARARAAGAEGLLVPSRHSSEGRDLIIFADALHRVTVTNTQVLELGLADATNDKRVRARLKADERLSRMLATAIYDGTLERTLETWVAEEDVTVELASGIREMADAVGGRAR